MNRLGLDLPIRPFRSLSNGNGNNGSSAEQKAVPQLAPGVLDPAFFWLDGNPAYQWSREDVSQQTAYMFTALAYICIRFRATKIIEAPLMVVEESQEGEKWLDKHELAPLLAKPNTDHGMRRLLEATQVYLDTTGRALWVKSRDRSGRVAALYCFGGYHFTTQSGNGRLYDRFNVTTMNGNLELGPEDVVLFSYFRPNQPHLGLAPLEPALSHLNLSQELKSRVRHMLRNAAMPGGIYTLPADAHLKDEEFARLKAEINSGFAQMNSGKALIAEGGGKFDRTAFTLKELALGDLWREMEAVICACFGVPAALVGVIVGLENSPWSHIVTARKSFYDETIMPLWADLEEAITDQLLRPLDTNAAHLIRFDTSRIRALQTELLTNAQVAANVARIWTLNERRIFTGKNRIDDQRADEVPELVNPTAPSAPSPTSAPPGADQTVQRSADMAALEVKVNESHEELLARLEAVFDLTTELSTRTVPEAQPITVTVPVTVEAQKQGKRTVEFRRNGHGELLTAEIGEDDLNGA